MTRAALRGTLFAIGFAAALPVVPAIHAAADHVILHGSACTIYTNASDPTFAVGRNGMENTYGESVTFFCPVPTGSATDDASDEGDLFDFRRVDRATIVTNDQDPTGRDGSTLGVQTCVTFHDGRSTGGLCSAASGSYAGVEELLVPTGAWTSASVLPTDHPYLEVFVPGTYLGARSAILGYRLESP